MAVKLGVNINHVATLRQARHETVPDPADAAKVCLASGADMIIAHLRRDRRHIQDSDILKLRRDIKGRLQVAIAAAPEMEKMVLKVKPDSVCIVPESKDGFVPRCGLDLSVKQKDLEKMIKKISAAGIGVSLFVEPEAESLRTAHKIGADTVELCTAAYAKALGKKKQESELERLKLAAFLADELKLKIHAGYGLDYHNVASVARIDGIEYLNIGYFMMVRAMFSGLKTAVSDMKALIQ